MRTALSRKLAASGYSIEGRLNILGVEVTCLRNPQGMPLLLVANVLYGPSWAQIHKSLKHVVPAPSLITLRRIPAVLVTDSTSNRELIAKLLKSSIASRGRQVHLEGVGFVELESKVKIDLKSLILPILSAALVVTLGILWGNNQRPIQTQGEESVAANCILDSHQADFDSWLKENLGLKEDLMVGQSIQKITEEGNLEILVEKTIGSAAKISGVASCADGRQRAINHRVDSSGSGAVLDLGQKLDS